MEVEKIKYPLTRRFGFFLNDLIGIRLINQFIPHPFRVPLRKTTRVFQTRQNNSSPIEFYTFDIQEDLNICSDKDIHQRNSDPIFKDQSNYAERCSS